MTLRNDRVVWSILERVTAFSAAKEKLFKHLLTKHEDREHGADKHIQQAGDYKFMLRATFVAVKKKSKHGIRIVLIMSAPFLYGVCL